MLVALVYRLLVTALSWPALLARVPLQNLAQGS
jgi:hypothetical protein